jgi:DNA-binding IclR family transcriptional regulator
VKTTVKSQVLEHLTQQGGAIHHSSAIAEYIGLPEPSVRRALVALVRERKVRRVRCTMGQNLFDYGIR